MFQVFAPAKINLGLRIVHRRPDGYHDLQSLFAPLTLGDELRCEAIPQGWEGTCDHSDVPMGEGSLVEKAFRFAAKVLSYSGGLRVSLTKKVPMGAGLGGGSSDAAAVMRIVEKLTGREIRAQFYSEIALKIGADIPFFLKDGPKWVEGVGDQVSPVVTWPRLYVLLVNPGLNIATKWVYQNLDLQRLTSPKTAASNRTAFESVANLLPYLTNDLESVVLPHYPAVAELKTKLASLEADAALMSGSGSTVFGLYDSNKKRDQALAEMKSDYPNYWVCACEMLGGVESNHD